MAIFDKQWWMENLQLHESPPINFERDEYEDYVNQNRVKVEKAAAVFNLPIDDMVFAFTAGNEVVLSDDMWSKLENSKSYKIKSLDDAIQYSLKKGINPKQYIDFIKEGKELPLPMVLCYGQDKYYLVGGDIILALYRALGSIPTVLQATLNLQTKTLPEPMNEEVDDKNKTKDLIKKFIEFTIKEIGLKQLPSGITISYDTNKAKDNHSFGSFDTENDKIWLYVGDRTPADYLRTLAHELVHRKQAEDNRLEPGDGETGSDIENEANAMAGVLLRKFGKENDIIYDSLNEGTYGDYLFGDKDSGVKIKWYDKEKEKDTPEEKELFNKLKAYADSEYETYSNMSIDDLLPILQKLKKQYPDIINPNLTKDQYIYRGIAIDIDKLEKLKENPNAEETKHNIIIPNQEYKDPRKLASWSTYYFVAASFAIHTAERKKLAPVVLRTKASNAKLFLNPDFMNKLSGQPEDEILNSTNPIPVDIMILKGFDTELEDYIDESFTKNWWKKTLGL